MSIFLSFSFIDLADDLSDCPVNIFVAEDFLCAIHKEHIQTFFCGQGVLLFSVTFPYPPFQKIPFDCSLEILLRYGNHHSAAFLSIICKIQITYAADRTMLSPGQKPGDGCLAA